MPSLAEIREFIAGEFPQGRAIVEAVDERSRRDQCPDAFVEMTRVGRTPPGS